MPLILPRTLILSCGAERRAMDFKITSAATAAVYNAIGVGRENATSRGDLVRQTGLPDHRGPAGNRNP